MKKRLERDQESRVVAGVLAGMADYFDQDPVLFRVVAISFMLITGIFPGLLFYLVAWVIMPSKKNTSVDYDISS